MKKIVTKIGFLSVLMLIILSCESESDSLKIFIRFNEVITDQKFELSDTKKENINANIKIWLKNTFTQKIDSNYIYESVNQFMLQGYYNYEYKGKEFIIQTDLQISDNQIRYQAKIKEFYMNGNKELLRSIKVRNEAKDCLTQVVISLHDNFGEL